MSGQQQMQRLLDEAGANVIINGNRPWDPQIHDPRVYLDIARRGSLALGEQYMKGRWECEDLATLFYELLKSKIQARLRRLPLVALARLRDDLEARLTNRQSITRSRKVGKVHYDNRLFNEIVLGDRRSGTCALWTRYKARTLDEAQDAKLQLVCEKVGLKKGDRVIDVGCGWGSFGGYAYEHYGAVTTGFTISEDQAAYARERYKKLPLEFRVEDYRQFKTVDLFDYAISLGMLEHVGVDNYDEYFRIIRSLIKDNGLFLLHCIVAVERELRTDPFIDAYIFPGGQLATPGQILSAAEPHFKVVEDVHNLNVNYEYTLRAWDENLQRRRKELVAAQGEEVTRMFEYYLRSCEGGFRARVINVVQFVLSPQGVAGGYQSVR